MKEKKEIHELRAQGETEKKRKSLLQLKQTIDHNKEVLQAKVNKKNFNDKKKLEALNTEKSVILGRGENPDFYIPRRQKMEDFIVTKKYDTLKLVEIQFSLSTTVKIENSKKGNNVTLRLLYRKYCKKKRI